MRRGPLAVLVVALAAAGASPALGAEAPSADGQDGNEIGVPADDVPAAEGIHDGCHNLTPAECIGAGVHIPGGDLGGTGGAPGCLAGRIVDPTTEDDGVQSDGIPYCPDNDGDGIADAPPTAAEIIATCPAPPSAMIGISPHAEAGGITGLETWFWHDGDTTASSASSIRGYAVSCRLDAVRFVVATGDIHAAEFGSPRAYAADRPGHEGEDTQMRHVYERVDTYTVTLGVAWVRSTSPSTGTATIDGPTASLSYRVREVRPVPTTAS